MKNSLVIAIQSCVITTLIVYALLALIFFEMDNALGGENLVDDIDIDKTTYSQQEIVETKECKSPCPSSAEMCIAMCA